jgi:hypothetical protein
VIRLATLVALATACCTPRDEPGEAPGEPVPYRDPAEGRSEDAPLRQVARLKAPHPAEGDNFGISLALGANGGTLAIAALREDGSSTGVDGDPLARDATDSGAVHVYRRIEGAWTHEAYLKPQHVDPFDAFGFSLALSADGATLAVGAYKEDGGGSSVDGDPADNSVKDSGAVYVFERDEHGWGQRAYLKAPSPGADHYFGWSVSLSADGGRLAVGAAHEETAAGPRAGAVHLFERSPTGWTLGPSLHASNSDDGDRFGLALQLSGPGTRLAVSAGGEASAVIDDPTHNDASGAGAVYVFDLVDGSWREVAYVKASNPAEGAAFGTSLDLSQDGHTLVVGAIGEASGPQNPDEPERYYVNSGAVYTATAPTWATSEPLKPGVVRLNTNFGRSVATARDFLLVGASWEHSSATGIDGDETDQRAGFSGAAYLYRLRDDGWQQRHYLKPDNTAPHQNFGVNVGMSDRARVIAVGASGESDGADGGPQGEIPKSGAVYVFER